jgi:hypothetical protein
MLFDNLKREKVSKREGFCAFFVSLIEVLLYAWIAKPQIAPPFEDFLHQVSKLSDPPPPPSQIAPIFEVYSLQMSRL